MSVNNFGLFFTRDGTVIPPAGEPGKAARGPDNDNSEYNVLGIGPIMIPRIPKLRGGDHFLPFPRAGVLWKQSMGRLPPA